jgi:1-acyl-sn-glycerol-3-phosphate acyltransferase
VQPEPTAIPEPPVHHIPLHLKIVTKLICIPLISLSTAFFGSISLVCGLWDKSGRQQHAIARAWAQTLVWISMSPVEVVGHEKLRHAATAVYAANHLSYMDTPVLFAYLPFQFRILAKQSLFKLPFVGWYLQHSGQVPIDQSSSRSAIAGLLRGVATLKSGLNLVVFPEGSRTENGHLQPAASGAAFMAIRAGVPLVPLTLVGTYELLPMHVYNLRPRPLKLIVGDPIPTEGLTTRDADALTARMYAEIEREYYAKSDIEQLR